MSITNNKYTKWIIGALVLLNLILLSVLFFLRPRHGGDRPKPIDFLKKELNLSDDQAVKIEEMRKAHFQKVKEERKAMFDLKKQMLEAISAESPDTLKANLIAEQIGQKEAQREKLLIQHYLDLQAECTPEQRQKLEHVFKKAMLRGKSRKGKRGRMKRKEAE